MKHVVSFSGGRTSAYLVYLMEQKRKNEGWDVDYVFMDTGAEHPKTYEFVRNVAEHFKISLTVLKAKVNPEKGKGNSWQEISLDEMGWDLSTMRAHMAKYGNFTINRPNCTDRFKTIIFDKYKDDRYGKGKSLTWLGIRADEPNRIRFTDETADMFGKRPKGNPQNIQYLASISPATKADVIKFWSNMPFDLELPEHLGNCVFCIKKSDAKLALAARDEPELYKEWSEALEGEHVRLMPSDKHGIGKAYRKWRSIGEVIATFDDYGTEKLRDTVYKTSKLSEGCEESCEVFGCQIDMFED